MFSSNNHQRRAPSWAAAVACLVLVGACTGGGQGGVSTELTGGRPASGGAPTGGGGATGGTPSEQPKEPGSQVEATLPAAERAEVARIEARLAEEQAISLAAFKNRYTPTFGDDLGYDPMTAEFLSLIQDSSLSLDDQELAALSNYGFVISGRRHFPHFAYGYQAIYGQDLPLYVSADSILDAVHRSYDDILKAVEEGALAPSLEELLGLMRDTLAGDESFDAQLKGDLDVYLAVAQSLLAGAVLSPANPSHLGQVQGLYDGAQSAEGTSRLELFGVPREIDFSQFTPRGHYTETEELKRYFRAMMWLGRIDFRMIETQSDGSQVFHRRQFNAAAATALVMRGAAAELHGKIDAVLQAFVGESDYMVPAEMVTMLADMAVDGGAALAGLGDAAIVKAIADNGFGEQQIASHIMRRDKPLDGKPLPLSRSYAVFGQRYAVDSHVFSNVVFDRTKRKRMMPSPLDAAFAALGNDQASVLLADALSAYEYQGNLTQMRVLVDEHGDDYWQKNLYTGWLGSLRTLSTRAGAEASAGAGLPTVAKSEAWGKRLLNTQLASWAQLRHDTILYVKQSYTGGVACEFPDAYVDPYPEFFRQVGRYADKGLQAAAIVDDLGKADLSDLMTDYFQQTRDVMNVLQEMAEYERAGTPFTDAHLAFINDAVVSMSEGCGWPTSYSGWYPRLLFDVYPEADPTIADVHTQPTDEVGTEVGRVLHVGTGDARLMVVTVNTCAGPRAYAGLSSSYYEVVTEQYERLTDEEWQQRYYSAPDIDWLKGPLVPDTSR